MDKTHNSANRGIRAVLASSATYKDFFYFSSVASKKFRTLVLIISQFLVAFLYIILPVSLRHLITIYFSETRKLPAVTDLRFLIFKYYFEKFVSFCSISLEIFHIDTFIC
jgi:hypothetical protein